MKNFPNIIAALFYEPLLITPAKHAAICGVIEAHLSGNIRQMPGNPDDDEEDNDYCVIGSTAIIPVHGVIGKHMPQNSSAAPGCDLVDLGNMVDMAREDPAIQTLLFDFNSPGGSATGVPEMARKISGIVSKKTVGFSDSECCSAAYWLASQCQQFYASESARVGSIGVWSAYLERSRQMANEGVSVQTVVAGKYKLLGANWKPLSDEEKGMLQMRVDKLHRQFKDAVKLHREVSDSHMEGQIYDGQEAVDIGLSDGVTDDIGELVDNLQLPA